MAFWDNWFSSSQAGVAETPRAPVRTQGTETARRLAGGRLTTEHGPSLYTGPLAVLPPPSADQDWRLLDLDADTLATLTPAELIQLLADLSPDISRALWDFLRLFDPGWEVTALRPGSEEVEPTAQAALDAFIATWAELYGAPDVVINRLAIGAFMRGAFCAELVLDARGRLPVDLVTPDPDSLRFRLADDAQRGPVWRLCQWQRGRLVDLDRPTIAYVPVDPFPGSPYGRPLAAPALFSSLFLLGLLHDLRRVVSQQGYPRLDLSVSLERLQAAMPADLEADPEAMKGWVAAVISEIQTVYASLEPDDAYIHTDVVSVNRPVGAVNAESLGAVEGLIKALERMLTRALKTMPLLMAITDGASEANANRQWEVHAAGIKALQHLCEGLLERLLGLALQAQGLPATVKFRFAELRAAEMLRDAQVKALGLANAKAAYDAGWISQDEAAQEAVGHAADAPEPRVQAPPVGVGALGTVNPEPGANRGSGGAGERGSGGAGETAAGQRIKIIPDGADEPLPAVPDEVVISEADIEHALAAWDEAFPDYAGLLDATVEEQQSHNTEAGELARPLAGTRAKGGPGWVWNDKGNRYRNTATGRYISSKQMLELRDQFTVAQQLKVTALAQRVAAGEMDLPRWVLDMRTQIRETFIAEYLAAHGGRANMTQRDWGIIGHMCRDQYGFLNTFAQDIAAGKLSPAQIAARARLYVNSSVQAFERGASEVRGLPRLPAYPADGSTPCGTNDKCTWEYRETVTTWECTWTLHPAEHCELCLQRSVDWAPLVIEKGAA